MPRSIRSRSNGSPTRAATSASPASTNGTSRNGPPAILGRRRQRAGQLRLVRAEGDDRGPRRHRARRARGELVEFAMQRPARAQQLDRIVMRADGDAVRSAAASGAKPRQVARHRCRQRAGVGLRQRIARTRRVPGASSSASAPSTCSAAGIGIVASAQFSGDRVIGRARAAALDFARIMPVTCRSGCHSAR